MLEPEDFKKVALHLTQVGPNAIQVIKVIREVQCSGLKEAMNLLDECRRVGRVLILNGVYHDQAERALAKFKEAGAITEIGPAVLNLLGPFNEILESGPHSKELISSNSFPGPVFRHDYNPPPRLFKDLTISEKTALVKAHISELVDQYLVDSHGSCAIEFTSVEQMAEDIGDYMAGISGELIS